MFGYNVKYSQHFYIYLTPVYVQQNVLFTKKILTSSFDVLIRNRLTLKYWCFCMDLLYKHRTNGTINSEFSRGFKHGPESNCYVLPTFRTVKLIGSIQTLGGALTSTCLERHCWMPWSVIWHVNRPWSRTNALSIPNRAVYWSFIFGPSINRVHL